MGSVVERATSPHQFVLTTKVGCECVALALQGLTELDPEATVLTPVFGSWNTTGDFHHSPCQSQPMSRQNLSLSLSHALAACRTPHHHRSSLLQLPGNCTHATSSGPVQMSLLDVDERELRPPPSALEELLFVSRCDAEEKIVGLHGRHRCEKVGAVRLSLRIEIPGLQPATNVRILCASLFTSTRLVPTGVHAVSAKHPRRRQTSPQHPTPPSIAI